ncbi:MAG TPA: NFACT family protein, partial [Ktedonobacterales bacterium]
MQMDALTLTALADELRAQLSGARIEEVIQPTPAAVALQCYGNGRKVWLLVSAHPQLARVHLLAEKPRKLIAEPPAFVMLLRKHLEGARIQSIQQPRWERLLEIGLSRGPAAESTHVWFIIEIMGRISNVILRDEAGVILGALHLVGAETNRYRTIAPHVPYRYPPPQTRALHGQPVPRLDGEEVTASALRTAAAETLAPPEPAPTAPATHTRRSARREAPTVAGLLAAQVLGFSRELGREVAARALGDPAAPLQRDLPWGEVARAVAALAALPETHAWQPTLVLGADGAPLAYAVYPPQQYAGAELRPEPSVNALLDRFYRGAEWRVAVEGAKADLRHLLRTHHDRCQRKDAALREELRALDEAQRLREEADILLAFQADIPAKATSFTTENPFAEAVAGADGAAPLITIALDPRYSAVESANRRYARYHKLQRAAEAIPAQIAANALELARIAQLQTDLALAETPAEIAPVRAEIVEAGYLRGQAAHRNAGKNGKVSKGKPGKGAKGGKGGKGT